MLPLCQPKNETKLGPGDIGRNRWAGKRVDSIWSLIDYESKEGRKNTQDFKEQGVDGIIN